MLEYVEGDFFTAKEDYLLCVASCTSNRLDRREPLTSEIFKKFPEADIYKARKVDGSKGSPGSIVVRGKVAVLLATFYPGSKPYPNDSQDKRLNWFAQGLKRLCTQYKPTSIAIREKFCEDSGGDWQEYLRIIDDLSRNLALTNQKITFRIYKYVDVVPLFSLVRYKDSSKDSTDSTPVTAAAPTSSTSNVISTAPVAATTVKPVQVPVDMAHVTAKTVTPAQVPADVPPVTTAAVTNNAPSKLAPQLKLPQLPKLPVSSVPTAATVPQANSPATTATEPEVNGPAPATDQYPVWSSNEDWKGPLASVAIKGWDEIMSDPNLVSELQKINTFFETKEMPVFGNHIRIFPPQDLIFNAFNLCPFEKTRVVIVGQDPYHSKIGEAMGLSFSVPKGIKVPSSLQNIYKELLTDIPGWQKPDHGDLTHWSEQGVLLINTALTVRQGTPKSHLPVWKTFTDRILTLISQRKKNLVFILWGAFAKQKQNILKNVEEHCIITGVHPSGLSASRGFFGSKPFSQTNEYLKSKGLPTISW